MIRADQCACVLVDVQGKLAEIMHEKEALFMSLQTLIKGAIALKIPVIWMEQTPDKMGPSIRQIRELLPNETPISKNSFSCCGEPRFMTRIKELGRKQILLAGIETHVCVYQTAADLVDLGYHVEVVADAVSSRTQANKTIGMEKIKSAGANITCVETLLLEMLRTAEHPAFRDILKIIK